MADVIKIKKGIDIRLAGEAAKVYAPASQAKLIGFNPDHFHGMVPKPAVKVGEPVKIGTVLFYDKNNPDLKVVSPVSGTLQAVNRGERRKILSIVVENDFKATQETVAAIDTSSADALKASLSNAGFLPFFKQRPYDVVVNPSDTPRAIFVSTFDKAPLAPDMEFILKDEMSDFQAGIDVLSKLAPVYVGIEAGSKLFSHIKNATVTAFSGSYPVSNVGVQINHIAPINKGETVWTITPQELVFVGRFANKGKLDFTKTVAFAGPFAANAAYYKVTVGTPVSAICAANISNGVKARVIAGNVLSGEKTDCDSYLNPFVSLVSVIAEGDETHEMLGWIMPRFDKYSVSGSFLSGLVPWLRKHKTFDFDTRILGGARHSIMSGEYDKVFPMDIYPEFLIKAIIAGDIDKMEALGIYEVVPEDFAAAEFVCSSKMELQKIVREGLDAMRKEMC